MFSLADINNKSIVEQERFYDEFINSLGFTLVHKKECDNKVLKYFCTVDLGIVFQQFLVFVFINKDIIDLNDILLVRSEINKFIDKGLIITTSKISRSAKNESRKKNNIPIDFIDKSGIENRLNRTLTNYLK